MIQTLQLVTTRRPFFEKQVAALERNGVSCTVLSVPGEMHDRSLSDYVRFYYRVIEAVADNDFDLIHANYGLTAPAALAQPTRPVVLSLWGSDLMGRYGAISERLAELCSAVVVMTDEMAAQIDRECTVVPHGIDTRQFAPQPRAEALATVGWKRDAKHVLFPYDPEREVKDFPRARRVVERASDRVDDDVELHAVYGVDHEEVPTYFNAADAMLLTSKREGSPNAVTEALACNLPVVATPVGDVPETLDPVECSQVCRSDEELAAALADVLTAEPEPNGRATVLDEGLDTMGARLVDVYDAALDDSRERRSSAPWPLYPSDTNEEA